MVKKWMYSGILILLFITLPKDCLRAQSFQNETKDQSGRSGILIFSGYYGWWLGIALAKGWDTNLTLSRKNKKISVMPLITTPVCLLSAYYLTENKTINEADASIITLGGHWGTWQGLGWAGVSDLHEKKIIQAGTLTGLVGIGTGLLVSHYIHFTPGGATLTHSGLSWGAWFGLLSGLLSDHDDGILLSDMLIGSNVLIFTLGFSMRDIKVSKYQIYGLNGLGYLSAAACWLAYWSFTAEQNKYDGNTAITVLGAGSVIGLVMGAMLLDFNDQSTLERKDSLKNKFSLSLTPQLIKNINGKGNNKLIPGLGLQILF